MAPITIEQLEKLTPEIIKETRIAAESGTLQVVKVRKNKFVIRDRKTRKVYVDGLRSQAEAFEDLKLMYQAERLLEDSDPEGKYSVYELWKKLGVAPADPE